MSLLIKVVRLLGLLEVLDRPHDHVDGPGPETALKVFGHFLLQVIVDVLEVFPLLRRDELRI